MSYVNLDSWDESTIAEATAIVTREREGADLTLSWRDAGYATAQDAAAALIGDGYDDDVRACAIAILAAMLDEVE